MKKNLLFFIFLCFFRLSFSQALPDLPLKNDKIYYVFETNFKNQKYCLGKYPLYKLYEQSRMRIGEKLKGKFNKAFDPKDISSLIIPGAVRSCTDTLSNGIYQLIIPGGLKFIDLTIAGRLSGSGKKRALLSVIKGDATLVFKSNNQYELKIKSLMLGINYMDGSETNIDLSKYYLELKKKTNISKNQARLFNDLDEILKLHNQALTESFQYIIENEELD
jgi:hypothetical protein